MYPKVKVSILSPYALGPGLQHPTFGMEMENPYQSLVEPAQSPPKILREKKN